MSMMAGCTDATATGNTGSTGTQDGPAATEAPAADAGSADAGSADAGTADTTAAANYTGDAFGVNTGSPGYFYVDGNYVRYNRMSFQKKNLKNRIKKFDPNISEIDNMMNNNYLVIFDSGSDKYEYVGG